MAGICLLLVFLTGLSMQTLAVEGKSKGKEQKQTSLKEAQNEKKELESELKRAKETIAALKGEKGDIQEKVKELNAQLVRISARITELENELTAKSEDIVEAQKDLEAAMEREARQYEDMKVRIQFMYENSQTSYLDVLLSTEGIAEFMNTSEYISEIESYDRQKLEEYEQTVREIEQMQAQLEQDYAELEEMKAVVEENKENVAKLMRQKEAELEALTDDILDAQSLADYYAAEIQAQEELIAEIKRAEAEKAAAGAAGRPYSGGAFVWPCPGSTRVTSNYGARISPTSGASTNHRGIDIGAAYGTEIVAAAPGTVKAVNYSSAAGNYVMIDHGGGLYTVYMHASSVHVSTGQKVSAGQMIARVGSTGISTGNHLHFGVSLNGSYVSPWGYLGG